MKKLEDYIDYNIADWDNGISGIDWNSYNKDQRIESKQYSVLRRLLRTWQTDFCTYKRIDRKKLRQLNKMSHENNPKV